LQRTGPAALSGRFGEANLTPRMTGQGRFPPVGLPKSRHSPALPAFPGNLGLLWKIRPPTTRLQRRSHPTPWHRNSQKPIWTNLTSRNHFLRRHRRRAASSSVRLEVSADLHEGEGGSHCPVPLDPTTAFYSARSEPRPSGPPAAVQIADSVAISHRQGRPLLTRIPSFFYSASRARCARPSPDGSAAPLVLPWRTPSASGSSYPTCLGW
jgi:hypothetical protein